MKKTISLIFLISIFVLSSAFAGDSDRVHEYKNVKHDIMSVKSSNEILFQLSQVIDLWHQANLQGKYKEVAKFEQTIFDLITDDLSLTLKKQMTTRNESLSKQREIKARHNNEADKDDEFKQFENENADKYSIDVLLKSKKRLAKSIRKSESFSYKYRLLNDYLHLLKKEVAAEKIEVAEDNGEWKEGR